METKEILKELEESKRDGSLQILRKLITCGSTPRRQSENDIPTQQTTWQPVLKKLLEILSNNQKYGKEQILLIPHAFLVLLHKQYKIDEFNTILKSYLLLNTNYLVCFDTEYKIQDINIFKLLVIHGYLQINRRDIYIAEISELLFEILYENCIRYTRCTHLAYKVLHTWLQKTSKSSFWENNDLSLEIKLETIIYSNWDNSIKEVCKQNSTSIFNQYLRIMNRKYNGFICFIFEDCLNNISWLNETKYVILCEIFDVWDNVDAMTKGDLVLFMFTSLTKSNLHSSGSKLYNLISNKLGDQQWKHVFGYPISQMIMQWESGPRQNYQAVQLLCTQWLEPTIKKHRLILPFLWEISQNVPNILYRSHLERIAAELDVMLQGGTVHTLINHYDEYLRLNSFATYCQLHISFENNDLENRFLIVKHFLFYNANSNSTFLRRGVIKYFKIWFLNLLKSCHTRQYYSEQVFRIFHWLHEFLLDCFEIGSCYQRKLLGIKLYEIILFYTNTRELRDEVKTDSRYREDLNNGFEMKQQLQDFGEWMFTNKTSLLWLLKLILDPANDVREISTGIILEHFDASCLSGLEKQVLLNTAITKCNSPKFFETESGSMLVKILSKWLPFEEITTIIGTKNQSQVSYRFNESLTMHTKYIGYLLHEAYNQLGHIKQDILRAALQNSPFHGTLTTILNVGFRNISNTELINVEFAEDLLQLLENAIHFLLSLLSSKSSECEFSSSFAEMGLAIDKTVKDSEICDEYDDIVLSPAHQVVITCIWISLKVSCELASEIGMSTYSYETVERSANIVTSVLMKCRHKGAIEAAGVAIGNLTRKLVNTDNYSKLPEKWLSDLTHGHKINPNLTRKSAGLSIMFHRIVANDNRHGRPLVHMAITNLLDLLENSEDVLKSEEEITSGLLEEDKIESYYQDLPRSKYLYFVQRLVADSDLHAQVVPYLERITMECFKNLQSEIWTVRNASLQLFGAIIPRIAGQQNGSQDLDFGNGYSVDHFVIHYSQLADHIFLALKSAAYWDNDLDATLKSHSAIVPCLIILSRMSTGGSDLIDYSSKAYILQIKRNLKLLLGSPIGNVRILAAKAYAALVAFPNITSECQILKQVVQSVVHPNFSHGYMCAIKYLGEKCKIESRILCYDDQHARCSEKLTSFSAISNYGDCASVQDSQETQCHKTRTDEFRSKSRARNIQKFWNNLYDTKIESNLCYVVETMSLVVFKDCQSFPNIFLFKEVGQELDVVLSIEGSKPGFCEFIDTLNGVHVDCINLTNFTNKQLIQKVLNSQCIDQSVTFLNHLKYDAGIQEIVLNYMLQAFPDYDEALLDAMVSYLNESVKNYIHAFFESKDKCRDKLMMQYSISTADKVHKLIQNIMGNRKYWKLELFCYIFINTLGFDINSVNALIHYCCAKIVNDDEMVRKSAAECLPCLLLHFKEIENSNKIKILRVYLVLLKDEVFEIRELARTSLVNYFGHNDGLCATQAFNEILYYRILDDIVMNKTAYATFTIVEAVQFFIECVTSINYPKGLKAMVESPFDHEDNATPAEETKLCNVIFARVSVLGKIEVLKNDSQLADNTILIDCGDLIQAKTLIQDKAGLNISDLKTILDISYNEYMVAKRNVVVELCNVIQRSVEI